MTTKRIRGGEFLSNRDDSSLLTNKWNMFEELVLTELIRLLVDKESFDFTFLHDIFMQLFSTKTLIATAQKLQKRNVSEINKKCLSIIENDKAFQVMLKKQVELNTC